MIICCFYQQKRLYELCEDFSEGGQTKAASICCHQQNFVSGGHKNGE